MEKILIVEDDKGVRFFLEQALKDEGYEVIGKESFEDALSLIDGALSLIIMDIKLPGIDGLSAIEEIKKRVDVPIIVVTAFGTKKNALQAIEKGATDFFTKPIPLEELRIVVKRALKRKSIEEELQKRKEEALKEKEFEGFIFASEAMKEILKTVQKIAPTDLSVLITGETGVGKEIIATIIHRLSGRKGEFVAVNCASIPENLLESELFGYEKGAFTGATIQKKGKFELAEGGSILLDEIAEMGFPLQAKLLRVIEKKEIERLGGLKPKPIDVRVLATTNREMEEEIKKGRFREDLYHRLSQIHIHIPPLRERKEDIEALLERFLIDLSKERGLSLRLEEKAKKILMDYPFPGNVRELRNMLRSASFLCEGGVISVDDLPLYIRGGASFSSKSKGSLDESISQVERKMIEEALKKAKGNQRRAAKILGISERSMWYRVKKYGISTRED
jgi:DNA-binding NtrC family response regulator